MIIVLNKQIEVEELEGGTVLQETDLYLSSTGTWQLCPCPGLTLQPGTPVRWVRPIEVLA